MLGELPSSFVVERVCKFSQVCLQSKQKQTYELGYELSSGCGGWRCAAAAACATDY